jgi:hypothetical protein
MNTKSSLYEKTTKKKLFEICESLHLTSYKSKNKSELIDMIQNKQNSSSCVIEEIEDNLESDEEISYKLDNLNISDNFEKLMENNIDKMENMFKYIEKVNNVVINDDNITKLYKLLHNANMRALNMQFKYRAQYPIAVYNNLEALKRRINTYNV